MQDLMHEIALPSGACLLVDWFIIGGGVNGSMNAA
jgi:hypothetical protein